MYVCIYTWVMFKMTVVLEYTCVKDHQIIGKSLNMMLKIIPTPNYPTCNYTQNNQKEYNCHNKLS